VACRISASASIAAKLHGRVRRPFGVVSPWSLRIAPAPAEIRDPSFGIHSTIATGRPVPKPRGRAAKGPVHAALSKVMQKIRHQHEIVTVAPGDSKGAAHDRVVSIRHPGAASVLTRNRNHCAPIEARHVALPESVGRSDANRDVACRG